MIVEVVDLGTWGAASLVSEYDPRDDAIRVNSRAVEIVRAALGDAEAECFTCVAIAHETYHRAEYAERAERGEHAEPRDLAERDGPVKYIERAARAAYAEKAQSKATDHRTRRAASEAAAHAFARATCGVDPSRYEAVLRAARVAPR